MLFEFPAKEDWKRLMATFSFERWNVPKFSLQVSDDKTNLMGRIQANFSLPNWERHLVNRLGDARQSYGLLMFYYERGIPDDEWMISPGRNGASIEYFPHFKKEHFSIKDQFDYYTDVFYFKAFSAWDTIGQLLNEMYQLDMKVDRVSFNESVKKLKDVNEVLHNDLTYILENANFKQAKEFRHSIAHRHPANGQGPSFSRPSENMMTFGGCAYTPSSQIVENIRQVLELLAVTIEKIKDRCNGFR